MSLRRHITNFDLIICGIQSIVCYQVQLVVTSRAVLMVRLRRHVHTMLTYLTRYPRITHVFRARFTDKSRGL